ncbi:MULTISPECIES: 2'-5' RNA ligase family protein [Streptomyces]|uniref:2'-5' RNA ligase family protein n=1 Tax=Streptomyces TaxID=1883 RepID=UPI001F262163|nr:2'-5' RNA ligase family protein [Streptomyces spororaveus]
MDDFFERVLTRTQAWPLGRSDLHWHILHDPTVVEEKLSGPYRELTSRPGLGRVEAQWLHTTLMHGGPMDEYKPGEVEAIIERVAEQCASISPFELTYERPAIGNVAVELAAHPGREARRLWEITTNVDAEVTGGRFPRMPSAYYPHASLAYGVAGSERPDRLTMKVLLSDHPGGPVTLPVDRISLVAQRHDARFITWTHIADVRLGTAS